MKDIKTNAIRILEKNKVIFKTHDYGMYDAISADEVARVLNESPQKVFKTLVTVGKSGTNYVFCLPATSELDLKKAAVVVNEKNIEMIPSKDLLSKTGYIHGGCSPVGMKKFFRTIIDISAKDQDYIYVSGGKIGIQVEITLEELSKVISFELYDIKSTML